MKNDKTMYTTALDQAVNEAVNEAWAETWAGLTPEQLEAAKRITPAQWYRAFAEVGLEICAGLVAWARTGELK
jgi:hypothetical protein